MEPEITSEEVAERRALKSRVFRLYYTGQSFWTTDDRKAFIRFEELTAKAMGSKQKAALLLLP